MKSILRCPVGFLLPYPDVCVTFGGPAEIASLREEHVRSPGMPAKAGSLHSDLCRHSLQYVGMLPLKEMDTILGTL